MHPSDPDSDHGLDAELRDVPLPEGLLLRLRQAALTDNEGLDTALRYIRIPSGLSDGLRRIPLADDEGLDAALCEVPVPAGLTNRLRHVPLASNEGLDAALRNVPIPASVLKGFQLPKQRLTVARLVQWATALSLMILIGTSYLGAMSAFLVATYRPHKTPKLPFLDSVTIEWFDESEVAPIVFGLPAIGIDDGDDEPDRLPVPNLEVELVEESDRSEHLVAEVNSLFNAHDVFLDANRLRDWVPEKFGKALTYPLREEGGRLDMVSGRVRRAVKLPHMFLAPESARFLSRYGVHPFVAIMHPKLQVSQVPLDATPLSYELALRCLADNELPPPEDIRTEEFLDRIDYHFPRPRNRNAMELYTAGGRSPFGKSPFGNPTLSPSLLQIGVRARDFGNLEYPPTHLVVVMEVSPAMRWDGRSEMIHRSLRKLLEQFGPEDRISLVAFSEDVEVLLEQGGHLNGDELSRALGSLSPKRAINVGAGLREAYSIARRGTMFYLQVPRVVLLSDGLAGMGRGISDPIEHRLADAAAHGVRLDVIDFRREEDPDLQLAGFAQAGGGSVYRAASADEIRWALLEIMTGKPQLLTKEVELRVTFNPKSVVWYRLFGHEARAMDETTELAVDFRAGQSATALYEIVLRPDGGKNIAKVELSWQPPGAVGSLDQETITRNVRRDQLAPPFDQAAPSLQAAALVAQTAEILRGSPFARTPLELKRSDPKLFAEILQGSGATTMRNSRMGAVLVLSKKGDSELRNWPSFVEFMSLVEKADKARPYHRGAR